MQGVQSHYEETVYFLLLNPQGFQVLIWSTLERWKAEQTWEQHIYIVISFVYKQMF